MTTDLSDRIVEYADKIYVGRKRHPLVGLSNKIGAFYNDGLRAVFESSRALANGRNLSTETAYMVADRLNISIPETVTGFLKPHMEVSLDFLVLAKGDELPTGVALRDIFLFVHDIRDRHTEEYTAWYESNKSREGGGYEA